MDFSTECLDLGIFKGVTELDEDAIDDLVPLFSPQSTASPTLPPEDGGPISSLGKEQEKEARSMSMQPISIPKPHASSPKSSPEQQLDQVKWDALSFLSSLVSLLSIQVSMSHLYCDA